MSSNAIAAQGTLLKAGDGASPESFTTISEVMSISGPSFSAATVEVTNHSSGTPWREFISTLLDAGEVSFDINFVPTGATHNASTGILRDMTNRTRRNFKLVFPDAAPTAWAFTGVYTRFQSSEPTDGKITAAVTIKLSGAPTLTGVSAS